MNVAEGIQTLSSFGLNIFLSTQVSQLPEGLYPWSEIQKQKTICLIGHGGNVLWEKLPHPLELSNDPIDNFSLQQIEWFAQKILKDDVEILFPRNDLILPLQKLGRFFNLCTPTPMGIDIHPTFGPWFAFRGVFLTNSEMPQLLNFPMGSACEVCAYKPCLIQGRLGCPIGKTHQYSAEQLSYHAAYASQIVL